MFTIGLGAAVLRVRREETAHRLGLPSSSMISIIEQERNRFPASPPPSLSLSSSVSSSGGSLEYGDGEGGEDGDGNSISAITRDLRDAQIQKRYKDAEPSLLELGQILTRRIRRVGGEWWTETFSGEAGGDGTAGKGKGSGGGWREKWRAGSAGE